jgi:hypothetical protein
VIASVSGATADEYAVLARAFGEAGAKLIEADLAEPYVAATLAPWTTSARCMPSSPGWWRRARFRSP